MNAWLLAAVVLTVALIGCGAICCFVSPMDGVVVLEVAGVVATTVLLLMSEGLHRQTFVDLALVFAVLSLIGALAFVRMLERRV